MKIRIVFDFDAFFLVELAKICVFVQVKSEIRCRRVLLVDIRERVALKHQLGKFLLRTIEHDSCIRFIDDFRRVSQIHPVINIKNFLISKSPRVSREDGIDSLRIELRKLVHPPVHAMMANDIFNSADNVINRTIDDLFVHSALFLVSLFDVEPFYDRTDRRALNERRKEDDDETGAEHDVDLRDKLD